MSLCGQAPTFEWAIQTEGPRGETGSAITTDKSGNIYVTGIFSDTVDFDPSSNIFNLTSTATTTGFSRDIFIAKYNTNGAFIWAFSLGSTEWDWGFGITTDTFENVYITGRFEGTIDFDPGAGVHTLSSSSNSDGFILKLESNGSFLWARNMGEAGTGTGREIVVDNSGNVFTIGTFNFTADFDPGPGVYNLTDNGFGDIFILKLNGDGDLE
jgi:hypothetical protein